MKIKPTAPKQHDFSRITDSAFRTPHSAFLAAFTLLELLVVVGIISVLLVAVIPAVNSLSKSSGRKGAISNLLGAIEQARAQAIKDGRRTYVVFPRSQLEEVLESLTETYWTGTFIIRLQFLRTIRIQRNPKFR